jgi:TrmH RNA methyltransferase
LVKKTARRPQKELIIEKKSPSTKRAAAKNLVEKKPTANPPLEKKIIRTPTTNANEIKYYGFHACEALWQKRPNSIIRVYVLGDLVRDFTDLLKWCAKEKKAYHIVSEGDLAKVAGSVHHEGICILARLPEVMTGEDLCKVLSSLWCETEFRTRDVSRAKRGISTYQALSAEILPRSARQDTSLALSRQRLSKEKSPACLLYLDGVQNPHNIGSVIRAAAHFGTCYILGAKGQLPTMSGAALRVAEGGAEHVQMVTTSDPKKLFTELQKLGFELIATSSHEGQNLYQTKIPSKCLFIIGAEVHGISKALAKIADTHIAIPGTGAVESLNVAIAAALLMAEHWRQNR